MVIVVFRARSRPDLPEAVQRELETRSTRMAELVKTMPGFVSYKDFEAPDGEAVTIVEFESHETAMAWRDHPEHRAVQAFGREHVFSEYHIQVCDLVRESRYPR